jgi:DNA-binding transcriptional LysR family regulator
MIELRRLRYFIAVAEEGHVTRAAERLGIQQPPLSRAIRALEGELGIALFHRLPRGVEPTAAGRTLLEEARAVLARAAQLPETARRAARGEAGRLAIGYTGSAAFHPFVARQIRAFRSARPGLALVLEEDGTPDLLRSLRAERLDAAFIRAAVGDVSDLVLETLMDEPMLAALPAGHALARRRAGIPLSALGGERFVLYRRPAGPGLYDTVIAACRAAGFSPTIAQDAPRMSSTLSLVAAGLGVSLAPASMQRLRLDGLAWVRLTGRPTPRVPLLLASRRGDRAPILAQFRRDARQAAARFPERGRPAPVAPLAGDG